MTAMAAGVELNCRRKARRILRSSPKPQRATMTPSGVSLCSIASRAACMRTISTALAGVRPVRATKVSVNVRRLMPTLSARTSASRWSATQANKELSGPAASEICPESTNALVLLDQSKGQVQCCGDAFSLAFLPQVGFELSEYAKHVEEGLAGRGTHIVRLLGGDG
jgi:hypothetical protein